MCSYPTYEEWKLVTGAASIQVKKEFLSYLWGMETSNKLICFSPVVSGSYPTYEEWKLEYHLQKLLFISVLILPMRNGNYFWFSHTCKRGRVLILPMRNGNQVAWISYLMQIFVLILPMRNGNKPHLLPHFCYYIRSYPTYEEWKQYTLTVIIIQYLRSYPTYEEWKQTNIGLVQPNSFMFLSYLWGMETNFEETNKSS